VRVDVLEALAVLDQGSSESAVVRAKAVARDVASIYAQDVDRDARFPVEAMAAIRKARLLGIMVPPDLGGEGADFSTVTAVCSHLATACASTGMVFAMHQIQVASLLLSGLKSPWHRQLFARIANEQLLLASATTEGGIGGNIRTSACAVCREGDAITIEKLGTVISYGRQSDGIMVTARSAPEAPASDQVVVPVLTGQYTLEPSGTWDALGMRGTCSESFRLQAIAAAEQICPMPFAEIAARSMLAASHIFWSGVWYGIAADAVARAHSLVREKARVNAGVQSPGATRLTEAIARLQLMRANIRHALECYEVACAREGGTEATSFAINISSLKISSSELVVEIVNKALMVCGLEGYRNDSPHSLCRHLRDAYSAQLMINNDRIQQNLAGLVPASRLNNDLIG